MSPLRLAASGVVAVLIEIAFAWALTSVVPMRRDIAFGVAFAAGYLALLTAIRVLGPSTANGPLTSELRAHVPSGAAVLLLALGTTYLCVDILELGLVVANTIALVVVVCWLALGYPTVFQTATVGERGGEDQAPQ